jgi:hypothetical protein
VGKLIKAKSKALTNHGRQQLSDLSCTFLRTNNKMAIVERGLFIGGRWCQPNARLPVISPATEQQIGTIPAGNAGDIDRAVKAACKAYYEGPWAHSTGKYRAGFMRKIAEKVSYPCLQSYLTFQGGQPLCTASDSSS